MTTTIIIPEGNERDRTFRLPAADPDPYAMRRLPAVPGILIAHSHAFRLAAATRPPDPEEISNTNLIAYDHSRNHPRIAERGATS